MVSVAVQDVEGTVVTVYKTNHSVPCIGAEVWFYSNKGYEILLQEWYEENVVTLTVRAIT